MKENIAPVVIAAAAVPMPRRKAGKAKPRKNSSSPNGAATTTVARNGTACAEKIISSARCLESNASAHSCGTARRAAQVSSETTGWLASPARTAIPMWRSVGARNPT